MDESVLTEVQRLLRSEGFVASGDYQPADLLENGRFSVDPTTLLLLLANYRDRRRG